MRSKVFLVILTCFLFLSCDSDDYPYSDVPSVVVNKFWVEFPEASEVQFGKWNDENYEVEFELRGKDHEAIISATGKLLRKKNEVLWEELPLKIRSGLQERFPGKEFDDAEIVTAGEKIYYQVQIDNFFSDENIIITESGALNTSIKYWD